MVTIPSIRVSSGGNPEKDDKLARVHFRLWQWQTTAVTVLATGWFVSLGPISAIIALMVAKHVLVAILLLGIDVDAADRAGR